MMSAEASRLEAWYEKHKEINNNSRDEKALQVYYE